MLSKKAIMDWNMDGQLKLKKSMNSRIKFQSLEASKLRGIFNNCDLIKNQSNADSIQLINQLEKCTDSYELNKSIINQS